MEYISYVVAGVIGIKRAGKITIGVGESNGLGYTGVGFLFINGMGSFNQVAQILLPNTGTEKIVSSSNDNVFGFNSDSICQVNGGVEKEVTIKNNWNKVFTVTYMIV